MLPSRSWGPRSADFGTVSAFSSSAEKEVNSKTLRLFHRISVFASRKKKGV
jgi:hypothetical protein